MSDNEWWEGVSKKGVSRKAFQKRRFNDSVLGGEHLQYRLGLDWFAVETHYPETLLLKRFS